VTVVRYGCVVLLCDDKLCQIETSVGGTRVFLRYNGCRTLKVQFQGAAKGLGPLCTRAGVILKIAWNAETLGSVKRHHHECNIRREDTSMQYGDDGITNIDTNSRYDPMKEKSIAHWHMTIGIGGDDLLGLLRKIGFVRNGRFGLARAGRSRLLTGARGKPCVSLSPVRRILSRAS
jgi:hypothetical protein